MDWNPSTNPRPRIRCYSVSSADTGTRKFFQLPSVRRSTTKSSYPAPFPYRQRHPSFSSAAIIPYPPRCGNADFRIAVLWIDRLLAVWEDSVRATHLFLSDNEIKRIKEYVPQALSGVAHLVIAEDENGCAAAFMGIEDGMLEMLFLSPNLLQGRIYCTFVPNNI